MDTHDVYAKRSHCMILNRQKLQSYIRILCETHSACSPISKIHINTQYHLEARAGTLPEPDSYLFVPAVSPVYDRYSDKRFFHYVLFQHKKQSKNNRHIQSACLLRKAGISIGSIPD